MNPIDEQARQATRRRVRVFVIGGILAVLVVGFWPLRGYEIHGGKFGHYLKPLSIDGLNRHVHEPTRAPVSLRIRHFKTFSHSRHWVEDTVRNFRGRSVDFYHRWPFGQSPYYTRDVAGTRARAVYIGQEDNRIAFLLFSYCNVAGILTINNYFKGFPPGKTVEECAEDSLATVLDAIDQLAPGVEARYMPCALLLWHDKAEPFLRKSQKDFPTITPP